jgi:uncharacterized membrane protein
MACITYITRVGGFFLISRIGLSKRLEAWTQHLPGPVLISIIAPVSLSSGFSEAVASLFTAVVAVRTGNLLFSMLVGVAVVSTLRFLV